MGKHSLAFVFLFAVSFYGLVTVFLGVYFPSEISLVENRRLADFPDVSETRLEDLPHSLDEYLGDHVPLREDFLKSYNLISDITFSTLFQPASLSDSFKKWHFLNSEESLEMRLRPSARASMAIDEFVDSLQAWDQIVGQRGGRIYLVLVPQKIRVYPEFSQSKTTTEFSSSSTGVLLNKLSERGVRHLYLRDELLRLKKNGSPVTYYIGADHHFNPRGDYQMYLHIMEWLKANQAYSSGVYSDVRFSAGIRSYRNGNEEEIDYVNKEHSCITQTNILEGLPAHFSRDVTQKIYGEHDFWLWYAPTVFKSDVAGNGNVAIFGDSFCWPKYPSRLPNMIAENFNETYLFPCYYFVDGMNYLLSRVEFPKIILVELYELPDRLYSDVDFYWKPDDETMEAIKVQTR